jgi:hypothetical protein
MTLGIILTPMSQIPTMWPVYIAWLDRGLLQFSYVRRTEFEQMMQRYDCRGWVSVLVSPVPVVPVERLEVLAKQLHGKRMLAHQIQYEQSAGAYWDAARELEQLINEAKAGNQ